MANNVVKLSKPFVVLCLEGCHGSGKTALTAEFKRLGFPAMDEGFMDQPVSLLHPQSLFMESVWVTGWFLRLMKQITALQMAGDTSGDSSPQIIIADRSPLSAVFYSRSDGHLLEPLIRQYVRELREAADVHIITVHLATERELLWSRITSRLAVEPERRALREDQRSWMDSVVSFYEGMAWDCTVANDSTPIPALAATVMRRVAGTHVDVHAAVEACAARAGVCWTGPESGADGEKSAAAVSPSASSRHTAAHLLCPSSSDSPCASPTALTSESEGVASGDVGADTESEESPSGASLPSLSAGPSTPILTPAKHACRRDASAGSLEEVTETDPLSAVASPAPLAAPAGGAVGRSPSSPMTITAPE